MRPAMPRTPPTAHCLTLLLLSGHAVAAGPPPKHTKAETVVPSVPQTQLTRPERPAPARKPSAGLALTLDQFIGGRQEKIHQLNQVVLDKYLRLLRVTAPDDATRADLQFRIAEAYAEQQRHFRFLARSLDQRIFEARGAARAQLEQTQKAHEAEEATRKHKAVESYLAVVRHGNYERMDEALYRLAALLAGDGRHEHARAFYLRLIRDHPGSRYIPDAYLSFAQFYFEQGEVNAARKFYEKVVQFPKSSVFGYALYKRAWCDINLGDYKGALQTFVEVIRLAQAGKAGPDRAANRALERAAQGDAVKAYARSGAPSDRAWEFCARVGGELAPRMLEALAELYWEQGMFSDSTKVYHRMMSLHPDSPRLCEWQGKVVRNTQSSGTKRDQVQEIRRLGAAYDRLTANPRAKADLLAECRVALQGTGQELVQVWHNEAQKTKNPETYLLVRELYQDHLQRFGHDKHDKQANDLRYFYAEALWTVRDWQEAARQYSRVIERDPHGKWARESAWAAVLAWKNLLDIDDAGRPPVKEGERKGAFQPRPLSATESSLVAAIDTFLALAPDAPEAPKVRYNKARVYYENNQLEPAVRQFAEVVERHPDDPLAVYSANLLLDSLNLLDRPAEVLRWIDRFTANPAFMKDAGFARDLASIRSDGLVREGKQHERAGDFRACGQAMLHAAESVPDHPRHAERLHDAAFCFSRARLIGRAVAARKQLIEMHPDDPLAQRAQHDLAGNYQQIAVYDHAARHLERFASRFPGEQDAPRALGNAYTFRVALGEHERALADMREFIRLYGAKRPREAADVFFQIGALYEKQNQPHLEMAHLEAYLETWAGKGTVDKQILAHFKLGEHHWRRSCPRPGAQGACLAIERLGTTARQRAFDEINRNRSTGKRKVKEKARGQCGPLSRSKITVLARSPRDARAAQRHFAAALRLYAGGAALGKLPAGPERQARAALIAFAAAGATFYQGEQVYEDLLRLKFPEGLELQPPSPLHPPRRAAALRKKYEAEAKVLKAYLDKKSRLAEALAGPNPETKGIYDRVLDFRVADWTIAALARMGQVWANYANQLSTAPIPRWLKQDDEWGRSPRDLYCDQLDEVADRLEDKALDGYTLCLRAAQQQSRFDVWSSMCEAELNQLRPNDFPTAGEIRPQPGYAPVMMSPAGVITELAREPSRVRVSDRNR
jgi:TolA-binding protein